MFWFKNQESYIGRLYINNIKKSILTPSNGKILLKLHYLVCGQIILHKGMPSTLSPSKPDVTHEVKVVCDPFFLLLCRKIYLCRPAPNRNTPLNFIVLCRYADNATVLFWKDTPSFLLQEELEMLLKVYSLLNN